ncbi:DUF6719 family protein [Bradyrhizobium erythrophlei]|uniref:DUF6719 family protein n=1 Tax=Bradyrhizobium erythrophlei TaxID=1437360 RepID=UPI0035EE4076
MLRFGCGALLGSVALVTLALPASAQQQVVSREQDIVDLRVGQRVLVDDGSCPAGQIKQIVGSQLTEDGVLRTRSCVQRLGKR